jgi:hypothetical protein
MIVSGPKTPTSSLARVQGPTINADATKAHGWKNHGILVVPENDPRLSWVVRELVRLLGEKLYGRRPRRGVSHG